jgi:prepilin-type N-terminal cleavage/methylation domain-containing protein
MVRRGRGFTLIELMLVVAIIALLAAIAIPKFADLVVKAKEAAVRGKLGTVRSLISIYYADNEGRYPWLSGYMEWVFVPKYAETIPGISVPGVPSHAEDNGFIPFAVMIDGPWSPLSVQKAWGYNSQNGSVLVNCSHTDSKATRIKVN